MEPRPLRRKISAEKLQGLAIALLTLAILVWLSRGLGANDLIAGDEGYYGVLARNIAADARFVVNPSLSPLGPPGDKPFLFPLLLAGGMAIGGVDEVPLRFVNLLLAAGVAVALLLLGRSLGSPEAGFWAALLYLGSPLLAHHGRWVRAEPAIALFGTLGIWALVRGVRVPRSGWALAAGALFGLAFLCKLWLALIPAAGAFVAAVAARAPWRRLGLSAVAFLLVASLHILSCAIATPRHLGHWASVYFDVSLAGRVTGGATFAYDWIQPWHYYLVLIARSAALVLPLSILGAWTLAARARRDAASRTHLALAAGWLLPLIPISIMKVKSGNYAFPAMPALLLLAGVGAAACLGRERLSRRTLAGAAVLALGFAAVAQIEAGGEGGIRLASPVVALLDLAWVAAMAAAAVAGDRAPRLRRGAFGALLAVTLAAGLARQAELVRVRDHRTGYARLAARLEPALRDLDPRRPCFFAPEWPSLSFYTFRSGRYWESPYVPADPDSVRSALRGMEPFFFVVDAGGGRLYGGGPDAGSRDLIEAEGERLRWGEAEEPPGLTVYVNASLARRLREQEPRETTDEGESGAPD